MGPTAADLHELDGADGGAPSAAVAGPAASGGVLGELAAASEVPFPGLASTDQGVTPGDRAADGPAAHSPATDGPADQGPATKGAGAHGPTINGAGAHVPAALDRGGLPRGDLAGLADLLRAAREGSADGGGGVAVGGSSAVGISPAGGTDLFAVAAGLVGPSGADQAVGTDADDVTGVMAASAGDGDGEGAAGDGDGEGAAGDGDGEGDWTVLPGDLDLVLSSGRRSLWAAMTRPRPLHPRRTRRRSDAATAASDVALAGDLTEPGIGSEPSPEPAAAHRKLPVSRPVAGVAVAALLLVAALVGLHVAGGGMPAATSASTSRSAGAHHAAGTPTSSTPASTPLKSSIPKSAILPPGSHPVVADPAAQLPTGSSSGGGAPSGGAAGPDLTQGEATLVVSSLIPRRAAALGARSPSELAAVDTGAALQGDEAMVLGSGTEATVDTSQPHVTVLEAQAYPLVAVAVMPGTAAGTAVDELVFVTEAGAGQPWMVSLVVDVPSAQESAVRNSSAAISSSSLDALAASWQQWAASGTAPTGGAVPFAPGGAYSSVGQATAGQVALSAMQGVHESVTFQAEPGSTVQPQNQGAMCGGVLETALFTSASGGQLTQPTDRSTWGAGVAPGQYASVTEQSVAQVCLVSIGGVVQVLGGTGGQFDVTAS